MNLNDCIRELSGNASAIREFVEGIDAGQARWKPAAGEWSVLEVINHLADEEREDFRARLQHLLSGSEKPAPPIAPDEWVIERGYNQRDLSASLEDYLSERERSVRWLNGLSVVDWQIRSKHAGPQALSAGDLLISWVAHDLLHIRQLVELKYAYWRQRSAPYRPDYAGDW